MVRIINARESDLKRTVEDYLQRKQAQGELIYLRLNSGSLVIDSEEHRRFWHGCRAGTADFLVVAASHHGKALFIETKASKGRQTKEQEQFERDAQCQLGAYYLIRDWEQFTAIGI